MHDNAMQDKGQTRPASHFLHPHAYRGILSASVVLLCIQSGRVMKLKEEPHQLLKHVIISRILEVIDLYMTSGPSAHLFIGGVGF
jgi:hypothetical protein